MEEPRVSVKTITTVREYDEQGRVVKETVTQVEHATPVVVGPDDWWRRPPPGWWQNPVISHTNTALAGHRESPA